MSNKKTKVAVAAEMAAPSSAYAFYFRVIDPFLSYQRGDAINDDETISFIIENNYDRFCVRVSR